MHDWSELDRLPGWKLRLLHTMEDLTFEITQVLARGLPRYRPGSEAGMRAVRMWRADVVAADAERRQVRLRCLAAGIDAAIVDEAVRVSAAGSRLPDSSHAHSAVEDPREHYIDLVAEDVFRLEQQALLHAWGTAVVGRVRAKRDEVDPAAAFLRNMSVLRDRAAVWAQIGGLGLSQAAEMWDRDPAGWDLLVEVTIDAVDEDSRTHWWQVASRQDFRRTAYWTAESLVEEYGLTTEPALRPPDPGTLIARAAAAVARHYQKAAIGNAVDTATTTAVDTTPGLDADAGDHEPPLPRSAGPDL
ncbi:hypothetical protein [Nocardia cyriacigeorgica]|uniref:hypothetical protein n=1 Tax=Nocardia cyriacigeorgica TaxID=135487 RepID=UPI0024584B7D|nr:hypothetical protein [Nocardia cyriacigeorgica]